MPNRLPLLSILLALSFFVLALFPVFSKEEPSPELIEALKNSQLTGEPYELAGNRIVFTNYYFIDPGNLLWLNDEGERVNTLEEPYYGPWDIQITRPSSPYGIEITTEQAIRDGRLEREKPWEKEYVRMRTILKEGDTYRAWGKCVPGGNCYFESKDGIHWERPNLGLKEWNGSTDNNLLPSGPTGCVFIDPSAPPEERYKSVGGEKMTLAEFDEWRKEHPDKWEHRGVRLDKEDPEVKTLQGTVSPDGFHWKKIPTYTAEHSDGMESGWYDERTGTYVIYARNWYLGPRSSKWTGDPLSTTFFGEHYGSGRRCIGYAESPSFLEFPLLEPLIVPNAVDVKPSEVFYTSPHTTIPGAPEHHLMLPSIWDTRDDTTSLGLWSSYNGRVWERVPGPRLLETNNFGEWDGGCFWVFPNLYERADGSWALCYRGYNLPHKYPRATLELYTGFMAWPKGRMVAVEAKEIGEFATVALTPPGNTLKVNALTKRAGGIRVELATQQEEVLPGRSFEECDPIQGDQFWKTVTWKGESDFGIKDGEAVVIRFKMDRAKLYGIEFE